MSMRMFMSTCMSTHTFCSHARKTWRGRWPGRTRKTRRCSLSGASRSSRSAAARASSFFFQSTGTVMFPWSSVAGPPRAAVHGLANTAAQGGSGDRKPGKHNGSQLVLKNNSRSSRSAAARASSFHTRPTRPVGAQTWPPPCRAPVLAACCCTRVSLACFVVADRGTIFSSPTAAQFSIRRPPPVGRCRGPPVHPPARASGWQLRRAALHAHGPWGVCAGAHASSCTASGSTSRRTPHRSVRAALCACVCACSAAHTHTSVCALSPWPV